MSLPSPVSLVSLKSFGDLVIARWALRRVPDGGGRTNPTLLIGQHLSELDQALGPSESLVTRVIAHGEQGVPSFFDARKTGPLRALRSGFALRTAVRELALPDDTTLLFDRVGARERFISAGHSSAALEVAPNIYLAYERSLRLSPATGGMPSRSVSKKRDHVGIFPGSRIAAKRLEPAVVHQLVALCRSHGIPCKIFVLESEPFEISTSAQVVIVRRSFTEMALAVKGARAVFSADSLPAHLAEYLGLPVFVLSHTPNPFWLPKSCFAHSRWCLCADLGPARRALPELVGEY